MINLIKETNLSNIIEDYIETCDLENNSLYDYLKKYDSNYSYIYNDTDLIYCAIKGIGYYVIDKSINLIDFLSNNNNEIKFYNQVSKSVSYISLKYVNSLCNHYDFIVSI